MTDEQTPQHHVAIFMAHADDGEFLCAGTAAKFVAEGHKVTYIIITNGDKGSEDPEISPEQLAEISVADRQIDAHIAEAVAQVIVAAQTAGRIVHRPSVR